MYADTEVTRQTSGGGGAGSCDAGYVWSDYFGECVLDLTGGGEDTTRQTGGEGETPVAPCPDGYTRLMDGSCGPTFRSGPPGGGEGSSDPELPSGNGNGNGGGGSSGGNGAAPAPAPVDTRKLVMYGGVGVLLLALLTAGGR